MRKNYSFTLIEMMVALSLFAMIVSTFFYWTHRHYQQQKQFERLKWPLVEERYLEDRIENMLSQATLKAEDDEKLQFSSDGKSLLFTFDNGAYTDSLLSNKVRCYITLEGDVLMCTLRPLANKGDEPNLNFPLLDKITSVSFSFYQPADSLQLQVHPDEIEPNKAAVGLHEGWEEAYHTLPAYVKLSYKREDRIKEAFFDLDHPILLPRQS